MLKTTRLTLFITAILIIGLGLLSRTNLTPDFIFPYIGDALYATMIYFFVAFLQPKNNPFKIALVATAICFCIEASQLINTDWLNELRSNKIARLVLGQGFLWSDLAAYVVGSLFGLTVQQLLFIPNKKADLQ